MDPALPLPVDALLEHSGWMRVLAVHLVRDAASADDVVQEAYLAALRRAREGGRTQRGWLARVIYNQAALHARSERHRRKREERVARYEALPSSSELAARAELQKRLVEAVLELRDPYRSVLILRFYEDLSPQEIAKRLGVPNSTVRSQITRGVAQVRDNLDANHGGDRRAWSLALVPLAAQRELILASAGTSSTLLASSIAMSLSAKLILSGLIAFGLWLAFLRDTGTPALTLASPRAPEESALSTDSAKLTALAQPDAETPTRELAVRDIPAAIPSPPPAHLRGRVIARHSDAPIAKHPLTIFGGPTYETLVTGEDGSFESPVITAAGRFWARLGSPEDSAMMYWISEQHSVDMPQEESFRWAPDAGEVVLQFTLGPTYALAFAVPPGLAPTDFEARLEAAVSFPPPSGYVGVELESHVLVEDGPIARFVFGMQSRATFEREEMAWRLTLVSTNGLWKGSALAPRCFGPCAGIVRIDLEPSSRLALSLVRSDGARVAEPKLDIVRARDGQHRRLEPDRPGATSFLLAGLEPGAYRLVVHATGCDKAELDLELVAGMAFEELVTLRPIEHEATVQGELRSRSGRFQTGLWIVLTNNDRSTTRNVPAAWVERDGRWVAPFSFEGLVDGAEYRLMISSSGEFVHRRWSPALGTVRAPAVNLVFVVDDEEPLEEVVFTLKDARSDLPVEAAHVMLYAEAEWVQCLPTGKPGEHRAHVWRGASLTWSVRADGYVGVAGTDADLKSAPRGRSAEVVMDPGWGARIVAYSEAPNPQPLAGVEIVFDGSVVGVTDSSGACDIRAEREPKRVEARLSGWRWSDGGGGSSEGRLWPDFSGTCRITLARRP